ncbi:hypothetical protein [Herbiconiux sp.]|uniref:hypothetical protein n=1 Tax=Herbiconiux sp. TaxID=1871186 RepID=UPI0025C65F00|nr:hypothetical protein [Herbiconiux sp.]
MTSTATRSLAAQPTAAQNALSIVSALLVVGAIPLIRPFILGERLTIVGTAMVGGALLFAVLADMRATTPNDRALRTLALLAGLLWLWSMLQLTVRPQHDAQQTFTIGVLTFGVLLATVYVLRNALRRVVIVHGLIVICFVLSLSFILTFLIWNIFGFGTGFVANIDAGYEGKTVPLYLPVTFTYSSFTFGGISVPRFLGIGRESGVMAALLGWAYFMLPRTRWNSWPFKLVLFVGLVGTQSTAGFAAFIVVWVLQNLLWHEGLPSGKAILKQFAGVFGLMFAAYIAFFAPVVGLLAKTELNPVSVTDRQTALENGIAAILNNPLAANATGYDAPMSSINLVAAIAVIGLPGFVLSVLAFVLPWAQSSQRWLALGPTLVLFVTLLLSQPLSQSPGFWIMLALGVAAYPMWRPSKHGVESGGQRGSTKLVSASAM